MRNQKQSSTDPKSPRSIDPHRDKAWRRVKRSGETHETARLEPHSAIDQSIEYLPPKALQPAARNARTHSRKQRRKLARLIKKYGFIGAIIADESNVILSGHLRHAVALELELERVPVIRISHLSDEAKRIYAIAANRLALDAGWDRETLALELGELAILIEDTEIDLEDTGFEIAELDNLRLDHSPPPDRAAEDVLPKVGEAVSKHGELWLLNKHRLLVGDARQSPDFDKLFCGTAATLIFADPPYNVSIGKHARRQSGHREFLVASGEMRDDEFANFLKTTLCNAARELKEGGVAYVCIDWRHMSVLEAAGLTAFGEMKNVCVWVKPNAGMGTFYRSQHELVLIFKKGSAPHLNTFELGQHGRSRTNVWHYAGVTSFKRGRREELMMHPTVKPTALIADVILDCSKPGDVVLDPFVGSGTTIVAAEKVGRRAYVMELDPTYADVSIRRWQAYTGRDAVLESTGETFEELAERRSLSSGCQPKKGRSDD